MTHSLRHALALGLLTACLTALTTALRADSPAEWRTLEALLERYDREADGPEKITLAARIDAIAHQKYATVSRLYWHTDLASASSAAREQGRPILHLRMLGRLDEELSCANSRLFRATLYANQDVSRFLRERFILYWSSERRVPRVTIDYGDGRLLERTVTGNSAHYVLDEGGNVLDVLPGLYAPAAFRRELEGSLALAERVRGKPDAQRAPLIAEYHRDQLITAKRAWDAFAGAPGIPAPRVLTQPRFDTAAAAAQRATTSKVAIERTDIRNVVVGLSPEALPEGQVDLWSAAGQRLYGIDRPLVLDEASRALVVRLHNAVPASMRATGQRLDAMIARLEQTVVADTAINQLRLRPQIAREIVRREGQIDFASLNAWIYADVFHTPRQDEWLGLAPRDVFTALLGDGIVIR